MSSCNGFPDGLIIFKHIHSKKIRNVANYNGIDPKRKEIYPNGGFLMGIRDDMLKLLSLNTFEDGFKIFLLIFSNFFSPCSLN